GEHQTHFNIAGIKKSSANLASEAAKINLIGYFCCLLVYKGRLLKRLKISLRDLKLGSGPLLRV
ncbi:unnamed protein product, partial [Brassica rapa]